MLEHEGTQPWRPEISGICDNIVFVAGSFYTELVRDNCSNCDAKLFLSKLAVITLVLIGVYFQFDVLASVISFLGSLYELILETPDAVTSQLISDGLFWCNQLSINFCLSRLQMFRLVCIEFRLTHCQMYDCCVHKFWLMYSILKTANQLGSFLDFASNWATCGTESSKSYKEHGKSTLERMMLWIANQVHPNWLGRLVGTAQISAKANFYSSFSPDAFLPEFYNSHSAPKSFLRWFMKRIPLIPADTEKVPNRNPNYLPGRPKVILGSCEKCRSKRFSSGLVTKANSDFDQISFFELMTAWRRNAALYHWRFLSTAPLNVVTYFRVQMDHFKMFALYVSPPNLWYPKCR